MFGFHDRTICQMNRPKFFIATGCSYTQALAEDTWPVQVHRNLSLSNEQVRLGGIGAGGNYIISTRTISYVTEALKKHKPEDILVGIMWSGCNRKEVYLHKFPGEDQCHTFCWDNDISRINDTNYNKILLKQRSEMMLWPTTIGNPYFNYYAINGEWTDPLTNSYMENFADPIGAVIETCEHILRTQWFLEKHKIKYFMTEYDNDVFAYLRRKNDSRINFWDNNPKVIEHPDVAYLYKQIDKTYWLPIQHLADWVRKNCKDLPYRVPVPPMKKDPHPGTEQHQRFAEQVILPFLLEKYNISRNNNVT